MDIAQLGIEVQSGGVKSATNDLKQFTNASRVAERAAAGLSDASGKFSTSEITAMAAAMGSVEKTSNAAAKALAAASLAAQRVGAVGSSGVKALGQSAGAARAQVQNLTYQMQDVISMMLQGQAPFMLLSQQLGQITQNGGQLTGVGAALKQTLVGLVSPLGLLTTGFVLLGSAALSYFTSTSNSVDKVNAILKAHAETISSLKDRYGEAAAGLREYVNEGMAGTLVDIRKRLEDARKMVADAATARSTYSPMITPFVKDTDTVVVKQWRQAFIDLRESIREGEPDILRFRNSMALIAANDDVPEGLRTLASEMRTFKEEGIVDTARAIPGMVSQLDLIGGTAAGQINGVNQLTAALRELAGIAIPALSEADRAGAAYQRARNAASNREERDDAYGAYQDALTRIDNQNPTVINSDGNLTGVPTPENRPITLGDAPSRSRSGGAKQKAYETATASVTEQTRALQAQTAAQATLNPLVSDYGYAVAKAKVETDLLLAAEKDKKAITPELTAQISKQAESYAQAVVEQNKLTEATKKATEAVNFVKNTTAGFINDLRDGLKNGESFWESFSNAALNVLDRITDKLLNDVLDAVFKVSNAGSSSGGGGFLSSLFGGLFGGGGKGLNYFPAAPAGAMYAGGTASARAGYALVGEEGPEIVKFGGGEQVVPNHRLGTAFSGGGAAANSNSPQSMHVTVGVSVDENGNLQAYVKDVARSEAVQVSTAVVRQNEKNKQNLQQNGQAQNG